jgi:hypothetical protein
LVRFYVRMGSKVTVGRIPEGQYRVRFALGEEFDSGAERFCGRTSYEQFNQPITYDVRREDDGTTYAVNAFTLHPVMGGTAKTSGLTEAEFWAEP